MPTRVVLTRHGQSQWNADSIDDSFNGRADVLLTSHGLSQVKMLAQFLAQLDIAAAYSSPLIRSYRTAEIIAARHGLSVNRIPELIEIDFGEWEGLTLREIAEKYPNVFSAWVADPATTRIPNGESGYDVAARVLPFLSNMVRSQNNETIVVVAHRVVNRIVLCHWFGLPIVQYRRLIPQRVGALNILTIEAEEAISVDLIDDLSYMNPDKQTMQ